MKAVTVSPRVSVRPSEYTVAVTGATHAVVEIECDVCGSSERIAYPVALLALMVGHHLFCSRCFAESSTRVVRDFDISELYDECR